MAAQPTDARSIADDVYGVLRERILAGTIAGGTWLRQEQLSADLGVSRTPLREALRHLASDGLVELIQHRGARVLEATTDDMRAAYDARLILEPGCARLAAEAQAPPALARMREAIAAQRAAAGEVAESFTANRDFHVALAEATGNPYLARAAEHLWVGRLGSAIYERQTGRPDKLLEAADEHERILEAIVRGDGESAAGLMRAHVATALQALDD